MTAAETKTTVIVVFLFLAVSFAIPLYFGIRWYILGAASQHWDTVTGKVIRIEFQGGTGRGDERINLTYQYEYDGTEDSGDRVCFGFPSEMSDDLRHLSANSSVSLYVNRENHAKSVIFPGATASANVLLFSGAGGLSLIALMSVLALRQLRKNKSVVT